VNKPETTPPPIPTTSATGPTKKPKADKKKPAAQHGTVSSAFAKPKPDAAGEKRK
jgi:hypothetical protein